MSVNTGCLDAIMPVHHILVRVIDIVITRVQKMQLLWVARIDLKNILFTTGDYSNKIQLNTIRL